MFTTFYLGGNVHIRIWYGFRCKATNEIIRKKKKKLKEEMKAIEKLILKFCYCIVLSWSVPFKNFLNIIFFVFNSVVKFKRKGGKGGKFQMMNMKINPQKREKRKMTFRKDSVRIYLTGHKTYMFVIKRIKRNHHIYWCCCCCCCTFYLTLNVKFIAKSSLYVMRRFVNRTTTITNHSWLLITSYKTDYVW